MRGGDGVANPPDRRIKPEINHLISFIQHQMSNLTKVNHTTFKQVFKPTRRGHQNIDALFQRIDLAVISFTTANHQIADAHALTERLDAGRNLMRQLSRRGKDQGGRCFMFFPCFFLRQDFLDQRQQIGSSLACSCLRQTKQITAFDQWRDGLFLNGCRCGDINFAQPFGQLVDHTKRNKCRRMFRHG